MAESMHPAAAHHLPSFVTPPGETDVLMVIMGIVLVLAVLGFGNLFFRLHSLPEQIAHKSHKLQMEIVAVLGLISLFTHMHIFWIAGLILAMVDLPDFGSSLNRIAGSAEKMAGLPPGEGDKARTAQLDGKAAGDPGEPTFDKPPGKHDGSGGKPEIAAQKRKEPIHV